MKEIGQEESMRFSFQRSLGRDFKSSWGFLKLQKQFLRKEQ
jgi:hypothetical protein